MAVAGPFSLINNVDLPAGSAQIWRYMSFPKLVSLFHKGLYFRNVTAFSRDDPHEGMLARLNGRHRTLNLLEDLNEADLKAAGISPDDTEYNKLEKLSRHKIMEEFRCRAYVDAQKLLLMSCWHISEGESAGMWAGYAADGIAIRTTLDRLEQALSNANEDINVGRVKYIDFDQDRVDVNDYLLPFTKRRSFSYEQELRLIIKDPIWSSHIHKFHVETYAQGPDGHDGARERRFEEIQWDGLARDVSSNYRTEIYLEADPNQLIEEVYVSPRAEGWVREAVEAVCSNFGLKAKVSRAFSLYVNSYPELAR